MSSTAKDKIEDAINKMAEESLRTLCLAYREVDESENLDVKDEKGVY